MEQDLSSIYSRSVQGRGAVSTRLFNSSSGSPMYERDPALRNLEHSVFSKINELTKDHEAPKLPDNKSSNLRAVSVEEAMRELLELEKSNAAFPPIS